MQLVEVDMIDLQPLQARMAGLDQMQPQVALGVDAVQTVGHKLTRRVVQLGAQLNTGRAGADDRHLQL